MDKSQIDEELKRERTRLLTEEDPETGEPYPLGAIEKLAKQRVKSVFEMNDEVDELLAKCPAAARRRLGARRGNGREKSRALLGALPGPPPPGTKEGDKMKHALGDLSALVSGVDPEDFKAASRALDGPYGFLPRWMHRRAVLGRRGSCDGSRRAPGVRANNGSLLGRLIL